METYSTKNVEGCITQAGLARRVRRVNGWDTVGYGDAGRGMRIVVISKVLIWCLEMYMIE